MSEVSTVSRPNKKLVVGVIGSRKWKDKKKVYLFLDYIRSLVSGVASGDADGPDRFGASWARRNGLDVYYFPPNSGRKHRYHYRNRLIVEKSDIIIAFWDGSSTGTQYTVEYARRLKKDTYIIKKETMISALDPIFSQ